MTIIVQDVINKKQLTTYDESATIVQVIHDIESNGYRFLQIVSDGEYIYATCMKLKK